MFNKSYEERLILWSRFRDSIEDSENPLEDLIDFYSSAPSVSIHTDPYDRTRWPNPWELLEENQYCEFCRVLAYCYSLQLTERFKQSAFEIHIITTPEQTRYVLYVDDWILGYEEDTIVHRSELPSNLMPQVVYDMCGSN